MGFNMTDNNPISSEEAIKLCKKYRDEHKVRVFSQCWGCLKFSKQEPVKMCFYNLSDNRGCKFVNQLYDK
jgi:hypothetical protein